MTVKHNHWRSLLSVGGMVFLAGCVQTTPKQTPEPATEERHGALYNGDFDPQAKLGLYGTAAVADTSCERPFDSVNPIVMAAELATIQEAPRLMDAIALKLGQRPESNAQQRKRQHAMLKEAAKFKVWMPVSGETLIGQQLHKSLQEQGALQQDEQLHPRDLARLQQIRKWVQKMVDVLPDGQPYTFQVFATRERTSTMAAQMGGFVYVSEGLLRDRGLQEADLALRLGHEISHVTKRHVLRDFQTKAVDAYTMTQQTAIDLKRLGDSSAMLSLVRQRYNLAQTLARGFDHANELEADGCAIHLLKHVMPSESIKLAVDNFAQQSRSQRESAAERATHPRSELRLRVMYEQLRYR